MDFQKDTSLKFLLLHLFYLMTAFKQILLNKKSMSWCFFKFQSNLILSYASAVPCMCNILVKFSAVAEFKVLKATLLAETQYWYRFFDCSLANYEFWL